MFDYSGKIKIWNIVAGACFRVECDSIHFLLPFFFGIRMNIALKGFNILRAIDISQKNKNARWKYSEEIDLFLRSESKHP